MHRELNDISGTVVAAAISIHKSLGPGLLESLYESALEHDLKELGLHVDRQRGLPVVYKSVRLATGFRPDLVIDGRVIVEVKAIESIAVVHRKQLLTYLKVSGLKLGLLLNFNAALMKDGIIRMVNGFDD
ncbi:MAG: GxxExxY protein [Blastocatellia bacterium]|jgi:GxxExxY protein|nr:GxxExxY protein [Blastocatellia bacterium]